MTGGCRIGELSPKNFGSFTQNKKVPAFWKVSFAHASMRAFGSLLYYVL